MGEIDVPQGSAVEEIDTTENEKSKDTTDEWIDILGSGSLKKKVTTAGIVETRPQKGDTVKVSVCGRLSSGEVVDHREELIFTIGDGEVLQGLDLIVPLMDKSEVAEVFMASRFAYGTLGLEDQIPPGSDLTYTVTLIDFKPEDEPTELSIQDRKVIGNRKRERGNWWFNREEYAQAIQCYKAACDFLDDDTPSYDEDTSDDVMMLLEERLKTFNNMAAAQIKLEAYDVALKSVDTVLMCQKNNIKALYRKGKILGHLGKTKEGVSVLKTALELDPNNRLVYNELLKLRELAQKQVQEEKSFYGKMLGIVKPKEPEIVGENKKKIMSYSFFKSLFLSFFIILALLMAYKFKVIFDS